MEEQIIIEEIQPVSVITTKKIDDYIIEITETKEPVTTVKEYDVNFLQKQLKDIQAQKDAFDADRDREIAEVLVLLKHCEDNSIVAKEDPLIEEPIDITGTVKK
jgi:hypothetical protein